jgi:hypothetical protein
MDMEVMGMLRSRRELLGILAAVAIAGGVLGVTAPEAEPSGPSEAQGATVYRMWNTPDGELHMVLERELTPAEASALQVYVTATPR